MIALALAGLLAFAPDSLDARCPGGDLVTRADLEASGATTVHDVLRLTPIFDGVTTDGFDLWPVSPAGVPFASAVRVFVDGAPAVRGGGAEALGLDTLPIAVSEIDHVRLCPGDGIAGGALGGPFIDVRTSPPAGRAMLAASTGNESGDPGPLLYLDPSLPNVDKWGPDFEVASVARTESGTAWLTVRDRDFLPTDPAILPRTRAATVLSRYPKRVATIVALAGEAGGLRARGGVRRTEDLAFVPALDREVPLTHVSAQATVSGERQRGPLRVWGHGHVGHVRLDRPPWSALALDPSWSDLRVDGALAGAVERRRQRLAAGVRLGHTAAEAPGFADAATVGQVWTQAVTTSDDWGLGLTIASGVAGHALGPAGTAEAWWQAAPGVRLQLSASARRTLPEERLDLDVWAGRGYDVLTTAAPARPADVARLRGQLSGRLGRLGWSVAAEGQRTSELLADGSPVRALAEGTAARATAAASWSAPRVQLRAHADAQGTLRGTAAFRDAWARVPRLGGWLEATVRPDHRLALWARVAARSATTWAGADAPRVPSMALLDLGISKRAWGDRLRLSLAGRNLLRAEERTHPLGAPLAPRLLIRAEARL